MLNGPPTLARMGPRRPGLPGGLMLTLMLVLQAPGPVLAGPPAAQDAAAKAESAWDLPSAILTAERGGLDLSLDRVQAILGFANGMAGAAPMKKYADHIQAMRGRVDGWLKVVEAQDCQGYREALDQRSADHAKREQILLKFVGQCQVKTWETIPGDNWVQAVVAHEEFQAVLADLPLNDPVRGAYEEYGKTIGPWLDRAEAWTRGTLADPENRESALADDCYAAWGQWLAARKRFEELELKRWARDSGRTEAFWRHEAAVAAGKSQRLPEDDRLRACLGATSSLCAKLALQARKHAAALRAGSFDLAQASRATLLELGEKHRQLSEGVQQWEKLREVEAEEQTVAELLRGGRPQGEPAAAAQDSAAARQDLLNQLAMGYRAWKAAVILEAWEDASLIERHVQELRGRLEQVPGRVPAPASSRD